MVRKCMLVLPGPKEYYFDLKGILRKRASVSMRKSHKKMEYAALRPL